MQRFAWLSPLNRGDTKISSSTCDVGAILIPQDCLLTFSILFTFRGANGIGAKSYEIVIPNKVEDL
jgi:hypothetical protein